MKTKSDKRPASLVRLRDILAPRGPIPMSASSWWMGISVGRYPRPVKIGPRMVAWRASDIEALIENGIADGGAA
jgi:predicted DNA-binding transcriptional regulator AlpA